MRKLLRSILAAGTLALGTACSTNQNIEFQPGFNAMYTGLSTNTEEGHTRIFTQGSIGTDDVKVTHKGLNEVYGTNSDTYFGRNSLGIEVANSGIEGIVEARGGSDGLFDDQPQYGFRDTNLPLLAGADYGFVQATTNGNHSNFSILYGKNMGVVSERFKPLTLELFNSYDYISNGNDSNLTELVADWNLNEKFSLFLRQDTNNLKFDNSNYVVGVSLKF